MSERIERVVTSGTFSLDGGCWGVDNNVWIVGNDSSVIIIDPAHDVDKISRTVAGRTVEKILLTHAHDDHIRSAKEAAERFGAPVYLNPADRVLWEMVYPPGTSTTNSLTATYCASVETELTVLATPAAPGSVCFFTRPPSAGRTAKASSSPATPFNGGPGATGRSYSDFDTIIESISTRLLTPALSPPRSYRPRRQHRASVWRRPSSRCGLSAATKRLPARHGCPLATAQRGATRHGA